MQFIGVIVADTDRAFLFHDWFWHAPEWMPKSQCSIRREHDTPEVIIDASAWISKEKGLQEFEERRNAEGDGVPDADNQRGKKTGRLRS